MLCMKKFCLIINVLFLLISCGEYREARSVMNEAESLMMTVPDSSLALLNGINEEALYTKGSRARYVLLRTMAKDKCYMDVAQDTVIQESYNWYQRHGSRRERMLATYYQGVVREQAGDNIEAVLAFREAEPLAESLEDYRQLSLIEQHLCAIYGKNYDSVLALKYAQSALEAAKRTGEELLIDYSKYDVAFHLSSLSRYNDAEELLIEIFKKYKPEMPIYSLAAKELAEISFIKESEKYEQSKRYYQDIVEANVISLNGHDCGILALIYEAEGNTQKADQYMEKAQMLIQTPLDSAIFYNDYRNLYDFRGDWEAAHSVMSSSVKIQNRIVTQLLERSISHAMENHFEDKIKVEQARVQSKLLLVILLGVIFIIITAVLLLYLRNRNRLVLDEMIRIQDISSEALNSLVSEKIKELQMLSESYFAWEDSSIKKRESKHGKQTKEEIISSFREQLSELRKDKSIIDAIERSLDVTENGMMKRLHHYFPNEKELDYSVITLIISGFSIKSISFLLRMSEASLRMRKTRYKRRFDSLPEPDRTYFLEKLG